MRFCDECGSHMKITRKGYSCPKCGNLVPIGSVEVKKIDISRSGSIYVVENEKGGYGPKVSRVCPRCGNDQALHWFSSISGEHAGVRQERTVEHFKCTRCLHSWGESH